MLEPCRAPASSYPFLVHEPAVLSEAASKARSAKWPLHIFLHGSWEKGSDLDMLKTAEGPTAILHRHLTGQQETAAGELLSEFLFIAPQHPFEDALSHWDASKLGVLIGHVVKRWPVDRSRITMSGWSMGSRGLWRFIQVWPDLLAGSVHIAGAPSDQTLATMKRVAHNHVEIYHGQADTEDLWNCRVENAVSGHTALVNAGNQTCRLHLLGDEGHVIANKVRGCIRTAHALRSSYRTTERLYDGCSTNASRRKLESAQVGLPLSCASSKPAQLASVSHSVSPHHSFTSSRCSCLLARAGLPSPSRSCGSRMRPPATSRRSLFPIRDRISARTSPLRVVTDWNRRLTS